MHDIGWPEVSILVVIICLVVLAVAIIARVWGRRNRRMDSDISNGIIPNKTSEFCSKCGVKLQKGDTFCPKCGTAVK